MYADQLGVQIVDAMLNLGRARLWRVSWPSLEEGGLQTV
jgi:hypothetical protein